MRNGTSIMTQAANMISEPIPSLSVLRPYAVCSSQDRQLAQAIMATRWNSQCRLTLRRMLEVRYSSARMVGSPRPREILCGTYLPATMK